MSLDVGLLYDAHWGAIFHFLRGRMPGAPDAEIEDLTATVFEKVCRFSDGYQERGTQPRAWLYQIARHALADSARARACRPVSAQILTDAPGGAATSDAGTDRHLDALVIADALAQLPPRYRLVIVERFLMGATHAETALLLKINEEAAKHIQARALAALRKLLLAAA